MIETKRLTFRKFIQSDLDDLYEYFSDPEVGESAGWAHHESKDQTQIVLDKFINDDERFANGKWYGIIISMDTYSKRMQV